VVVVDISQPRIDAWNSDKLPIYEPRLDDVVFAARCVRSGFRDPMPRPAARSRRGRPPHALVLLARAPRAGAPAGARGAA